MFAYPTGCACDAEAGRCWLKPVFAGTESEVRHIGCLTRRTCLTLPCMTPVRDTLCSYHVLLS